MNTLEVILGLAGGFICRKIMEGKNIKVTSLNGILLSIVMAFIFATIMAFIF